MATSTRYYNTSHLLLLSVVLAKAQQGVLVNGNNRLPDCAQDCLLLIQAAKACSASIGTATPANWMCFCQSAYLDPLRSSAGGICDQACPSDTDREQLSTWYNSNCGGDFGASEHGTVTTGVVSTSMSVTGSLSSSSMAPSESQITAMTSSPESSTDAESSGTYLSTSTIVITSSTTSSQRSGTSSAEVSSSDTTTSTSSSTNPPLATSTSAAESSNAGPHIEGGAGKGVRVFALVSILFGLIGL